MKVAERLGVKRQSVNESIEIVKTAGGKLVVNGMILKELRDDSKYSSKYDSWEILNSQERIFLGYAATNPSGITMSGLLKIIVLSEEKIEEALKKLTVNELLKMTEDDGERTWKITQDGRKFRERNYWSQLI